ncbi:MAG: hypothetical protein V4808_02910 [Pseudomonadota bacterium]
MQTASHPDRDIQALNNARRPARAAHRCAHCGQIAETTVKRGAYLIRTDPLEVLWRGRTVPLSPTEAHVFRTIAVRGRATNSTIDEALCEFGSSAATRSIVMMRIRRKFIAMGSDDPFERLGKSGIRLRIDADVSGSVATVVGDFGETNLQSIAAA